MIHINSYKLTPAITATWGDITGNVSNQEDLVEYISTHGGGNAAWGSISGNISDQVDLQNTLGSYATQSWVSSQQFVTESWVSEQGYLVSDDLSQYATRQWVTGRGYATESWVSDQGYLHSINVSGDKRMAFDTDTPSIFMRDSVSRQLRISPWLISMYGSSTEILITPNAMGTIMGDASSYKTAGAICDVDLSSAVLIVRDVGDTNDYLKIDCHNIYTYSGGISITYPLSEFASKGDLSGYATESWVGQQGYAFNSDLTSLASRVAALETNYGDAITITNNILG